VSRFFAAWILSGCLFGMCASHNTIAKYRGATADEFVGEQTEKARTSSPVGESNEFALSIPSSQLPRDVLPSGGVVILGPNPYSWRVWPSGRIEYSFDGSHTWEQQKSGVTTDLTAGSAPSGKVCWVVGKEGAILLTNDRGKHWRKLPSPTKEDIEGVNAEDGKRASIWTVSHRRSFATNDGGSTWIPNSE
jgi:hypothetical protein